MLDMNLIRENPELVIKSMKDRQMDPAPVNRVIELDMTRRKLLSESEQLKAERNATSKEIGRIKDAEERNAKIEAMRLVGDKIAELDKKVKETEEELNSLIMIIPNIPDPRVPYGISDAENVVVRYEGKIAEREFDPIPHWDLGPALGIIDFDRGVKLTGSRFYILNGAGARLQRALIAFMLDLHIRQGYEERYTPFMVKSEILYGSGQLPKFRDNLYHDAEEDFWMVPTAEVPLTGLYMNEIIEEDSLPMRFTSYTPCFRREKMSAGRDVRGIKRGHQFDKVEMYCYSHPDKSADELDRMLNAAEETCRQLDLPYRIVAQCTGDLGFNARICYDIEVWAPGCKEWLEVSSVSDDGDFQSRRGVIRFRDKESGKTRFLHTLNGSGLGLPRTLIAVLETYQQAGGSVVVPEVLKPWMGGIDVIEKQQ
ncbi:MAG TPA: serine--tRNA ligase [Flexilinea sp.]|jgi:seryl-tRNA synthetase|nr:serine--tRNA ligase [Flexilinea sp.]HPJ65941.1 serine--tRNA ligase [Flexilinea sp.]HPR69962.1 serine--tRNA ligase [Flexilinea sp.]